MSLSYWQDEYKKQSELLIIAKEKSREHKNKSKINDPSINFYESEVQYHSNQVLQALQAIEEWKK